MPGELGNPEEQPMVGHFERSHPTTSLYSDDPYGNVEDWERGPYGEQILRVVKSLGSPFKKKENEEDGDK